MPFGLNLETLTELPPALQADILNFLLPEEDTELTGKTEAGLSVLGWAVGAKLLAGGEPSKKLLHVLFRLYLALRETGPASFIFSRMWPEPEPSRVTYFSELIQLNLALENLDAAQQVLEEMQELFPDRYTTSVTEAEVWLYQGELEAARLAYLKGLETNPTSRRLILNLALVAHKQEQIEEVTARLVQLEEVSGFGAVLPLQAIKLWQKLGNSQKACRLTGAYRLDKQEKQAELARQVQEATLVINTSTLPGEVAGLELLPELARPEEALPEAAFQVLRDIFGHEEFRPGQEQVIANILAGHDTLAVLPTGAGKSLCYQLPAMLLPRPVLVLSPLISLMKDQFDKLPPALKAQTLIINSSLEPAEAAQRLRQLSRPDSSIRLVYAAPERLRQTPFIKALTRGGLSLIVVDEAHCVTMWGNDFRPDYLFIRRALAGLVTPLLAVTATATPQVAGEITRELGRDFKLVQGSVYRSNLSFRVEKILTRVEQRLETVAELCQTLEGSGIIYTRSREKCEQIAAFLRQHGVRARHYHAGLDGALRQQTQESWTSGQTRVIVATIAFGMGIDKPDVRFIIHFNPATSLENYMQEAGRAGRDGQIADCIMLYSGSDKGNLSRWLREDHEQLDLETLRAIYRVIAQRLGRPRRGIVAMSEILGGSYPASTAPDESQVRVALSLLEQAGLLERSFDLPLAVRLALTASAPALPLPAEAAEVARLAGLVGSGPVQLDLVSLAGRLELSPVELDFRLLEWQEAGFVSYDTARRELYLELKDAGNDARSRLEELLARRQTEAGQRLDHLDTYLKAATCRQVLLARHFGEKIARPCGTCDNCVKGTKDRKMPGKIQPVISSKPASVNPPPKFTDAEATGLILGCLNYVTGGEGAQMGRSGLVNLLMGRKSAFGTRANNPFKGKFENMRLKDVEALVEKQLEAGFIDEHPAVLSSGRSYQAIRVCDKGQLWLEANQAPVL
ncbi:MAG: hypothetical protein JWP00_3120 [Chloroflexi bacterium]|nr:hypothetical protein [Chloroflexota bacterium]